MTKHRCSHPALAVGERVQFKLATEKAGRHKGQSEWQSGVFGGIITCSTAFIVMNSEGLYKCTIMQKAPEDSVYDPKCVGYASYNVEQYIFAGAKVC